MGKPALFNGFIRPLTEVLPVAFHDRHRPVLPIPAVLFANFRSQFFGQVLSRNSVNDLLMVSRYQREVLLPEHLNRVSDRIAVFVANNVLVSKPAGCLNGRGETSSGLAEPGWVDYQVLARVPNSMIQVAFELLAGRLGVNVRR